MQLWSMIHPKNIGLGMTASELTKAIDKPIDTALSLFSMHLERIRSSSELYGQLAMNPVTHLIPTRKFAVLSAPPRKLLMHRSRKNIMNCGMQSMGQAP
jgi:hypothetical protein